MRPVPPTSVSNKWPTPNFKNPVNHGPALDILTSIFIVIVTVILALRLWVRIAILKFFGADDWLMFAAYPPLIVLCAASILSTRNGWGIHIWDQRPEWYGQSEMLSWLIQLFYSIIMTLIKLSILVSYLRIFPSRGWIRWFTWGTIGVVAAAGVGVSVAVILTCWPVDLYWKVNTGDPRCGDETVRLYVASIISIVTDIIVVVLPIRTFWKLSLPKRQKFILIVLMSLGLLAASGSIIRTAYMAGAVDSFDITWEGWNVWLWTTVECSLAIICASIPALRPLARKYFKGFSGYRTSDSTNGTRASRVRGMFSGIRGASRSRSGTILTGNGGHQHLSSSAGDDRVPLHVLKTSEVKIEVNHMV